MACPKPVPYTVTLADPVPARFDHSITLTVAASVEKAVVNELTRSPAVRAMATRLLPRSDSPTRHLVAVSDDHSVASQAV